MTKTWQEELIKVFKDGNMWCCMAGKNIQDGFAVFSKTKDGAINKFNKEFECFMSPDCPCDDCQKENILIDK